MLREVFVMLDTQWKESRLTLSFTGAMHDRQM
jgi:hypothetical protein